MLAAGEAQQRGVVYRQAHGAPELGVLCELGADVRPRARLVRPPAGDGHTLAHVLRDVIAAAASHQMETGKGVRPAQIFGDHRDSQRLLDRFRKQRRV